MSGIPKNVMTCTDMKRVLSKLPMSPYLKTQHKAKLLKTCITSSNLGYSE